jgi:hypothetical protein
MSELEQLKSSFCNVTGVPPLYHLLVVVPPPSPDADGRSEELRHQFAALKAEAQGMIGAAKAQGRDLTDAEAVKLDAVLDQAGAAHAEIERLQEPVPWEQLCGHYGGRRWILRRVLRRDQAAYPNIPAGSTLHGCHFVKSVANIKAALARFRRLAGLAYRAMKRAGTGNAADCSEYDQWLLAQLYRHGWGGAFGLDTERWRVHDGIPESPGAHVSKITFDPDTASGDPEGGEGEPAFPHVFCSALCDGGFSVFEAAGFWIDAQLAKGRKTEPGETVARVAELLAGDGAAALLAVAHDTKKTVDQRQREMAALDSRLVGWTGEKWCNALHCTASAARKTEWWTIDRPRLIGPD